MKRAIFAAITLLGLSSPLIAGPFGDADAAYDKGGLREGAAAD
jgi:hypothetical protein